MLADAAPTAVLTLVPHPSMLADAAAATLSTTAPHPLMLAENVDCLVLKKGGSINALIVIYMYRLSFWKTRAPQRVSFIRMDMHAH